MRRHKRKRHKVGAGDIEQCTDGGTEVNNRVGMKGRTGDG